MLVRIIALASALPIFLAVSVSAQIAQPYEKDNGIVVTTIAPPGGSTGTIDVYSQCAPPLGPSLLPANILHPVPSGGGPVPIVLTTSLSAGDTLCAIETFSNGTTQVFPLAIVRKVQAAPAPTPGKVAIHAVTEGQSFLIVDVLAPAAGTASIDIGPQCPTAGSPLAHGTSLLTNPQPVTANGAITVQLKTTALSGNTLCAVETYSNGSPAVASAAINVAAAVPPAPAIPATQLQDLDTEIRKLDGICKGRKECLSNLAPKYTNFQNRVSAALAAVPPTQPGAGDTWNTDYALIETLGNNAASAYADGSVDFTSKEPTGKVSDARILGGIDVSAASSADPAAKFLLDVALDIPLPGGSDVQPIDARDWLWGYVRLSSIQQPGAINGITTPATYVQGLTAASPNAIVQSFEAVGGYELQLRKFPKDWVSRPMMVSLVASGGIITPISDAQATPNIYIATQAIQNFYTKLGTTNPTPINATNAANVSAACPTTTPSTTCYIAQYSQERTHLFRDYSMGFRIKRYYYNSYDRRYIFPASFDITGGQNEYVTGGSLRRWVVHFGGSTPLGILPGVTAYAYMDLVVSKNSQTEADQQFPLATAASNITTSSPNVAAVYVSQPDRDRYRFGIAYDLATLKQLFKK